MTGVSVQGAGYQVYVAQPVESDPAVCAERSTHCRTLEDISALSQLWEDTPATFPQLNLRPLLSPSQRVQLFPAVLSCMGASCRRDRACRVPILWLH